MINTDNRCMDLKSQRSPVARICRRASVIGASTWSSCSWDAGLGWPNAPRRNSQFHCVRSYRKLQMKVSVSWRLEAMATENAYPNIHPNIQPNVSKIWTTKLILDITRLSCDSDNFTKFHFQGDCTAWSAERLHSSISCRIHCQLKAPRKQEKLQSVLDQAVANCSHWWHFIY